AVVVLAAVLIIAAITAGALPAFVVSLTRPSRALAMGRSRSGPGLLARVLVGVQFLSASFLIIVVTTAQLQRGELDRALVEQRGEPIVVLNELGISDVEFGALETRLRQTPGVLDVSVVNSPPWGVGDTFGIRYATTQSADADAPTAFYKSVGYGYFTTFNLRLLAGRTFDADRDTRTAWLYQRDSSRTYDIIVDQAYTERLGFAAPEAAVGEIVYMPSGFAGSGPAQPAEIIGVTETETTLLEASRVAGHVYAYGPNAPGGGAYPIVRLSGRDVPATVEAIVAAWDELAPNIPANVRFFDQLFEENYRRYARVSQLFILLAGTAFIIASIGQLGIAVHAVSRRRHEIGVRKVLGSTSLGVVRLLLVDFSKPALIANLLAWPLGYFAAQTYLSAFAHRIELTPAPFLISMAITLAIAWAAVIGEVLKAASVRPAEVLRHA
ncbi:MAG: hypothetical protein PVI23_15515, partial [Maricaulaceae bacterium]